MYPVDLPAVGDTELKSASEHYLSSLDARSSHNEWFQSSKTSKVAITAANVRQLPMFEDDQPACAVLALHPPDDQTRVVALYLHGKWWRLDDVLRTSSKSRCGLVSVQSITERVIVFLLSQVVERPPLGEVAFSLHPRSESCKVLWRNSQAVGFYTIKHKGSLCDSWSSCCYLLPVLDTVLVRRSCRGRGFGLQILEDFCSSFSTEEFLGVSSPISPSMAAVIRRFLQRHEEFRERLYEVEAPGGWTQRRNIWLNIQLGRYSLRIKEESGPTSGQTQQIRGTDLTSPSTCNMNAPLLTASAERQIKPYDVNRGQTSQSSQLFGTGCSSAAHAADVVDSEPLTGPQITERALKSKAALSTKHSSEEPEEMQRGAKRAKVTHRANVQHCATSLK
ncbi:protein FAM169B isoform 1-T4 [Odontesthes bonariensis]|uniref:protein FAM169B isoform X1 n=2 Tax=Odontesthes bonariensis TaxID=219752 RepID=UPI003F587A18